MKTQANVILILADDMGYGDCGCFGSKAISTPNIDSIAERGVRFTDFHSNGAVCSPTRAALLTGRYQQRCGIEGVVSAAHHRHVGMPLEETTFADLLRQNGYRTALFGKWHLGYERRFNPVRRGFDEFRGFVSGNVDYKSHIDQSGNEDWWLADELSPEDGYTTDLVTEHGVRFINENADKPFCLFLAHECPHYPYQGPNDEAYRKPGKPDPILGPRQDQAQAYAEMMESMDQGIGRIVDTVRSKGIEENTLIFFFSDNGPCGPGSSGPLRAGKGTVWEGGHRVPAAVCMPGTIPPGITVTDPCMGMDLFPTMTALANITLPEELKLDGRNLLSLLACDQDSERALFWRYAEQKAVRRGKWKLVVNGAGGPQTALFDLEKDIGEKENRLEKEPDVARALQQALEKWEADVGSSEKLT